MEDVTGLGKAAESVAKIIDSEVANKAYDDLLADPLREGGKALTDLVKSFRLFLAPIQLLAVAQDRLANLCEQVRAKVPEDRQQEAAPSIALPILMDLRFMEDDNPLTELFLNLLARAIDKERCNEAHPAFVKIIEQLSPDEAMVIVNCKLESEQVAIGHREIRRRQVPLMFPENSLMYEEHLQSLNLLPTPKVRLEPDYTVMDPNHVPMKTVIDTPGTTLTAFGSQFVKACIPEDFDIAKFKGNRPNVAD